MTTFDLVRALAATQVTVAMAFGLVKLVARAPAVSAAARVTVARAVVVAACVAPLCAPFVGRAPSPFAPRVQVWSAPSRRAAKQPDAQATVSIPGGDGAPIDLRARWIELGAAAFAAIGVSIALLRVASARRSLARIVARGFVVHAVGRARVVASSAVASPFAARLGGRALVVVDVDTLASPARGIALRHELTHHRRGDVGWSLASLALLAPSLLNPLSWLLLGAMRDLDELACDEAVLARGVAPRDYGLCLIDAAARGSMDRSPPVLSAALSLRASRALLTARLEAIASPRRASRLVATSVGVIALGVVVAGSASASGIAVDRRVDRAEAEAAAAAVRALGVDVALTPAVLAALARLVATADGSRFVRAAMARRSSVARDLERALAAHCVSRALTAVALVESGYRDLGPDARAGSSIAPGTEPGAGVWMFIPATARAYGLRVDAAAGVDERLDVPRETDAAAQMLADLEAEFGDVALALAAYNQGAHHVHEAIAREGTRDAFELERRGALNDYAATVLAAALVEARPSLASR